MQNKQHQQQLHILVETNDVVTQIAEHYREILRLIGEDPDREGLIKTPLRAAKALYDITRGYRQSPLEIAQRAVFEHAGSQIVIVKDIEFYSMCEHHILPFFGRVSIAYIPDGKMIGLSKLARIVEAFARRLQVQERLTAQVCSLLTEALPNHGVLVTCNAEHLCMKMRGVEKQDSSTVTLDYNGRFKNDAALRAEAMRLLGV